MNQVSEHPTREQLSAFAWGHLGGSDLASLSRHINACDTCCQTLREIPDDPFLARLREVHTPVGSGDANLFVTATSHSEVPKELRDHPRYKIGRFLGAGGMGAVYLAEHRMMGRAVALKIIHRKLTKNPRVIERFHQEVKAAARLSHPNIVTAYDAEHAGDVHFLVMEFVDGMSLDRVVASKGPLEIAYACNFVRQAAKGLQHAFEAGMVHRDIKPHNLMLTRKGQIKILDFGLARLASETRAAVSPAEAKTDTNLTRLGEIMGTPDYIAPEQITAAHDADIRADLYSLGCTFYFLLTGHPPFADRSPGKVLQSQQHRPPPPLSDWRGDVPAELATIVNKLLAKRPADRYATPADLVKALTPFLRIAPAPAPAKKAATPSVPAPPAVPELHTFQAHCPFCTASIRLPDRAIGVSIPCPHCSCYFTAVPVETPT